MNQPKKDDRRNFLIRYRIKEDLTVSFIEPCCDDIPVKLFMKVMKAIGKIETEWNNNIRKKQNDKRRVEANRIIFGRHG